MISVISVPVVVAVPKTEGVLVAVSSTLIPIELSVGLIKGSLTILG